MVHAGGDTAYGTTSFTARCMNREQSGTQEVNVLGVFEKKKKRVLIN